MVTVLFPFVFNSTFRNNSESLLTVIKEKDIT